MRNVSGKIIYVGKAKNLRRRLGDYFLKGQKEPKVEAMLREVADFEIHLTTTESEALHLEERMILDFLPSFNIAGRTARRRHWIVSGGGETLPKFEVTSTRPPRPTRHYGPYPSLVTAAWVVSFLNRLYGLRSCHPCAPSEKEFSHCMEHKVNNCSAPCAGKIDAGSYLENFARACAWLDQPKWKITGLIEEHMKGLARRRHFEQAARVRDVLNSLGTSLSPTKTRRYRVRPSLATAQLQCLREELGLREIPEKMEAFDISHMGGKTNIASVVVFKCGQPSFKDYRTYTLPVHGSNDVECMRQALIRRYTKVPMPDIILVDGGIPQLHAALSAFGFLEKIPPCLIALAKERETIFRADGTALQLELSSPALHMVQRIRDEAHRTANSGTRRNSSRIMRDSSLLKIRGLGPRRVSRLLREFKTVKEIIRCSPEKLAPVLKVSPEFARKLCAEMRESLQVGG